MKALKLTAAILGTTAIFIYVGLRLLNKTFDHVQGIEQIIWNLANSVDGTDPQIIKNVVFQFLKALGFSILWIFIVFKFEPILRSVIWAIIHPKQFWKTVVVLFNYLRANFKISFVAWALFGISIVGFTAISYKAEQELRFISFITKITNDNSSQFIEKHYYVPTLTEVSYNQKNNLVIVMVESFERSFFSKTNSVTPLVSSLSHSLEDSEQNRKMVNQTGGGWTIAALTGWHFGLPLKLPPFVDGNNYRSTRGFLPNAQSIFDILSKSGYETVLVMGSDSHFSSMDKLFSSHGNFRILDKVYWIQKGYDLNKYLGTGWGFSDRFVLDRAQEEYTKLKKSDKPFVLFVETIDTHAPEGYCPSDKKAFGDIRDAIAETDRLLNDFVSFVRNRMDDSTVLAVIGDHYFMGSPSFLKKDVERHIFNAFWGAVPKIPELKQRQLITAVDIAPTLLQASGARWKNGHYGLGTSLFSPEESLAQKYGAAKFNYHLDQESRYYYRFY